MSIVTIPIAEQKIKLRYREKYLTEGVNERSSAFVRGIYRGFYLAPSGVPDQSVWLVIDPFSPPKELDADSFAVYNAKNVAGDAYALSIREIASVELDLSTIWPGGVDTLYVYIVAQYLPTATTTASYNVSDEDPHNPLSSNYDPYALLIGAITYDFSLGVLNFDPQDSGLPLSWYLYRDTPQPTWVDDDLFDGGFQKGDEQWGMVSGFERRNFATKDEKDAMTFATLPSSTNPFLTLNSTSGPLVVDVSAYGVSPNYTAITGIGKGFFSGVYGIGGSNSGPGARGTGGSPNGVGLLGVGYGGLVLVSTAPHGVVGFSGATGYGVRGVSVSSYGGHFTSNTGTGVYGEGGNPNGSGGVFLGAGASIGSPPNRVGVIGISNNSYGGYFTSVSSMGVYGLGGTNMEGVRGLGNGSGAGVVGLGGSIDGAGVYGEGGATKGVGILGVGYGGVVPVWNYPHGVVGVAGPDVNAYGGLFYGNSSIANGIGLRVFGGSPASGIAGIGIYVEGGNSVTSAGGVGANIYAGDGAGFGNAAYGLICHGGATTGTGFGGGGIIAYGGSTAGTVGGVGVEGHGGNPLGIGIVGYGYGSFSMVCTRNGQGVVGLSAIYSGVHGISSAVGEAGVYGQGVTGNVYGVIGQASGYMSGVVGNGEAAVDLGDNTFRYAGILGLGGGKSPSVNYGRGGVFKSGHDGAGAGCAAIRLVPQGPNLPSTGALGDILCDLSGFLYRWSGAAWVLV